MITPYLGLNAAGDPMVMDNDLAQRFQAGDIGFRTNATLRRDEWRDIDTAVLQANRSRLIGIADIKARGLVHNISQGLYTTVMEYEKISKMGRAKVSMDGEREPTEDRVLYSTHYFPLPIIHQDFSINERVLGASRMRQSKLDTTQAEESGRTVAEEQEIILFQGSSAFAYGGGTIYGYIDHPNRQTGSITAAWGASGADPVQDVINMKQALIAKGFYGPFCVYIPTAYETALDANYVTGAGAVNITVRERILKIGNVEAVKVADYLATGNVVMAQMTSNVVRMITGMPLQTRQWTVGSGMRHHFKVLTIDVPQIRADKNDNCGVAHYSV